MFDRCRDHVATGLATGKHDPLDRHVARFGSTTGEDDFTAISPKHRSDFCPGVLNRFSRCPAKAVTARRIAVVRLEKGHHRFDN